MEPVGFPVTLSVAIGLVADRIRVPTFGVPPTRVFITTVGEEDLLKRPQDDRFVVVRPGKMKRVGFEGMGRSAPHFTGTLAVDCYCRVGTDLDTQADHFLNRADGAYALWGKVFNLLDGWQPVSVGVGGVPATFDPLFCLDYESTPRRPSPGWGAVRSLFHFAILVRPQ